MTALGCSAADADIDVNDSALMLDHPFVDVAVLTGFAAQPRSYDGTGAEVVRWNLRYMRTRDGFVGLVAFGEEATGHVRYLTALDTETREIMVLDGIGADLAAPARAADAEGGEAEAAFVAASLGPTTIEWLRSELYRMQDALVTHSLAAAGGITTQDMSAGQACAARLAIFAISFLVPFTKIPMIGRGGSIAAQYAGSFLVGAAGAAALGDLTEGARAASAGSGAALSSVLAGSAPLVQRLGASGAGHTASFIVGAIIGADGDLSLAPGDTVENRAGKVFVRHADGTVTEVLSGTLARALPATCRQALGTTR